MRLLLFSVFLLSACASGIHQITIPYEQSPLPPAPDYSLEKHWAALPGKRDAADSIPLKSSLTNGQASAQADVFFIYPTIFTEEPTNQYKWNADVNDAALNSNIQLTTILNQATAFNGSCRVYTPYYRQAHLYAFYTPDEKAGKQALELAYQDVKSAFEYYLKNYNNGRPIVIASHSQGSYHGMRLVSDFFDGKELQKQLVMAYLVGRAIPVDVFKEIKPTTSPDEVGVWASWNTFAFGYTPTNYDKNYTKALSINPLLWNSSEDPAPKELNHGGVGLKFTMVPQATDAQNHSRMLWIHKPYIKGRFFVRRKIWHRADINLFYVNIRENVDLRVRRFLTTDHKEQK